jgi:hypothetical protein
MSDLTDDPETSGIIAADGPDGHHAAAHINGETQTIEVTCECGWGITVHSRDNRTQGTTARFALAEHRKRAIV